MALRKTHSRHFLVRNKIELWKNIHLCYWIWFFWWSFSIEINSITERLRMPVKLTNLYFYEINGISFVWRSFLTFLMLHLPICCKNVYQRGQSISINRPPGTSRSRFMIENALGTLTRPNNMWTAVILTVFPQRLMLTGSPVHRRLVRPHRKMLYIEYGFSG